MNLDQMLKLAKNNLKTAILLGMFLGALSFVTLVVTQKSFRSNVDFLVAQNQTGTVDYYTLSRSADYLTSIMTEAVYSEKFLDEVLNTGKVSTSFLSGRGADRLDSWKKTVSVKKNSNIGILNLSIFANSENQAAEISGAVLDVLEKKNSLFLGEGQNLQIRILSGPIIEKNPSPAQIFLAALGGFAVGFLLFLLFIIYRTEYFKDSYTVGASGSFEMSVEPRKESFQETSDMSEDGEYWRERLNKMMS
jgi:capsular polysaccharide biosynthesis protein